VAKVSEVPIIEDLDPLPSNWEWVQMNDISAPEKNAIVDGPFGSNLKVSDYVEDGPVRVLTTKNLYGDYEKVRWITWEKFEELKRSEVKPNDILMAKIGSCGKTGVYPPNMPPAIIPANLMKITVHPEVERKYVYYYYDSLQFQKHLRKITKATAMPAFGVTNFKRLPFPLAPPEQQKRIVAKIEELFSHVDAGIAALNKSKQLLKQYRQSVLKAAVTGELTKQWREDNKDKLEPASQLLERILQERRQKWEAQQLEQFKAKGKVPKDDKWKGKYKEPASMKEWSFLCELPDSWLWASVAEIGDTNDQPVLTGPFGSNLGKKDFIESGVPVLTIGCLKEAGVELKKAMYVSEEKADELERYRLKDGDMLFSRMAAVGRAGHVNKDIEGCLFNYHIMRLRLHSSAISQEYFVHYVRGSTQVYDYVKEVNHGATRDGINTQQLLEMPVALPCLVEQYEICSVVKEKLDSIRRLELEVNNQLVKAEKNKQSILASAFSGRI